MKITGLKSIFLGLFLICFFAGSVAYAEESAAFRFPPKAVDGVFPRHYQPERTVDFEHLNLDIKVFMAEKRIEGTAHYRFKPINDTVKKIRFDANKMKIKTVQSKDYPSLTWNYAENALYIDFPEALKLDKSVDLDISYSSDEPRLDGKFSSGMHFTNSKEVDGKSADQMFTIAEPFGASVWFPCFDYPSDRLTTEISVTVPEEFTTLSNGKLLDSKIEGGWKTDHWKQEIAHSTYLVSLAVGHFDIVRDEWKGKPVEYYVEKGLAKEARPSMGKTPEMIDFLSKFLDYPYPYEKYAQVAARYFTAGGMEHTTATTMYQQIVMDASARLDTDMEGLIVHELCHQWFGDLVTCKNWGELWMNEGFATYSEPLWKEHTNGKDGYLEAIFGDMETYINSSRAYTRPIVTNTFDNPDEMFDSHSYPKGGSVLHMLRQELGDDLFRKSLHNYLTKNAPGMVDTHELMDAIEETTGKPMSRFFEQWIYRPGHPVIEANHEWLADQNQVKVTLKQTQKMNEGDAPFVFPLEIEIRTDDQTYIKIVQIQKKEESVFIDCPKAPKSVVLDPNIKVLMELNHKKTQDMLLFDLEKGSTVIVKIRAVRGLADYRQPEVLTALNNVARKDPNRWVRLEAIETLGKERTPQVLTWLIELAKDPDAKIRRKAVNNMDGFYKDGKAIDELIRIVKSDPSSNVAADAIRVLGNLKAAKAMPVIREGLKRDSWMNSICTASMNALVNLKDDRVFPDLLRLSTDPNPREVQVSALHCLGSLAEKTKKHESETLERLLKALKSKSEPIRSAAISALQSAKLKDAIPQLRWVQKNDSDKDLREAAERAVSETYKDQGNELAGKNAGRIDTLEDQNKKMENRVKDLESKIDKLNKKSESKSK